MNTNKINPAVLQYIKPIIENMTAIKTMQESNPLVGTQNEPTDIKEYKKSCLHIIMENGEPQLAARKNADGKLVCSACGRVINTVFDDSSVQKIMDCIEVLNQLVLFGTLNGIQLAPLQNIVSIKSQLPGVALLVKELNKFVVCDNAASQTVANIGMEYADPRSITGY